MPVSLQVRTTAFSFNRSHPRAARAFKGEFARLMLYSHAPIKLQDLTDSDEAVLDLTRSDDEARWLLLCFEITIFTQSHRRISATTNNPSHRHRR